MTRRKQRGATLIELVIAIVVISTVGVTLIGLLAFISRSSAEGMARAQSASIANAYLKDVLNNPFDDIDSYDGRVDNGAVDALGNTIPPLAAYRVAIDVTSPGLGAVPGGDTRLVTITVTDPLGEAVILSGFKTRHP